MIDNTRMESTGYGYYVNNWNNTGGRSFPRSRRGLENARDYYRSQRNAYQRAAETPDTCIGCGEPESTKGGMFCYDCRHPNEPNFHGYAPLECCSNYPTCSV